MRALRYACLLCLLLALPIWCGCGYPQAEPENLGVISSLRTALSARNAEWLEKNAEIVEERRAAGQMSDVSYQAFQSIITTARDGHWEKAEKMSVSFEKSQRPPR